MVRNQLPVQLVERNVRRVREQEIVRVNVNSFFTSSKIDTFPKSRKM